MELRRYFSILRRRLALIVLTVVAAGALGWFTTDRTPAYTAQSTVYLGAARFTGPGGSLDNLSNDAMIGLERLLATYAVMVRTPPIASDAIQRTGVSLSPESVVSHTLAYPQPGTNLLNIRVSQTNPEVAQSLANGLADAFVSQVTQFERVKLSEGSVPAIPAIVSNRAQLPVVPDSESALRQALLFGLFGLLAAAGLSLLVEYLDVTIKSVDDAERRIELPVLAVIPLQRHPLGAVASRVGSESTGRSLDDEDDRVMTLLRRG